MSRVGVWYNFGNLYHYKVHVVPRTETNITYHDIAISLDSTLSICCSATAGQIGLFEERQSRRSAAVRHLRLHRWFVCVRLAVRRRLDVVMTAIEGSTVRHHRRIGHGRHKTVGHGKVPANRTARVNWACSSFIEHTHTHTCIADRCAPSRCAYPWRGDSGTRSWSASPTNAAFRPARSDGHAKCTRYDGIPPRGAASARCWTWCADVAVGPPCAGDGPLFVCEKIGRMEGGAINRWMMMSTHVCAARVHINIDVCIYHHILQTISEAIWSAHHLKFEEGCFVGWAEERTLTQHNSIWHSEWIYECLAVCPCLGFLLTVHSWLYARLISGRHFS